MPEQLPLAVLPIDTHVTDLAEQRRLSGQNAKVLARLQAGPATRRDLGNYALNVTARISDLRAAGYDIKCDEKPGGLSIYRLVEG